MRTQVKGRRSEVRERGSGFRVQENTHKAATIGRAPIHATVDRVKSIANCKLQIANGKVRKKAKSEQWAVDSGQCETESGFIHPSSLILHPSSFILHPSSYIPSRRGLSLIEVLVSIAVLSIGLLGVAALIPLGQIALWETAKADRSGACGRAAMREIEVRRMLDYRFWYWTTGLWGFQPPFSAINPNNTADNFVAVSSSSDAMPFVIDPLGRARGLPEMFGQNPASLNIFLPRRTLRSVPLLPNPPQTLLPPPMAPDLAEQIFFWSDDLPFDVVKNSNMRPKMIPGGVSEGSYSWFFTIMSAASESQIDYTTNPPTVRPLPVAKRRMFNVSVVVCYKRNLDSNSFNTSEGEHAATINANTGFPGMGIGGGTVILASSTLPSSPKINVKENQWVMLYHLHFDTLNNPVPQLNRCNWYRVVGVGMDVKSPDGLTSTPMLSLNGPDWDPNLDATLVVVPGVIGVYTTTMELDWDPLWTK